MKRNISDILDSYRDDRVQLELSAPLSSQRIKELTMNKVKRNHTVRRCGTRLLIAAAIISMLAVTAFAAGNAGIWFRNYFSSNGKEELTTGQIGFIEENAKDENQGDTIGSYHVALDSFLSDGGMTHVKIAIQAVEGAVISDCYYTFREMDVLTSDGENASAGITWAPEAVDVDKNTAIYLMSFDSLSLMAREDEGRTVTVELKDLCMGGTTIVEGNWKFEIEIPDISMELISEPLTGFELYDENGNALNTTVISVVFRPMGVTVKYERPEYNGVLHPVAAKAVMKDGSVKEFLPVAWSGHSDEVGSLPWVDYYGGLILPEEVDYIALPGDIPLVVNAE